MPPKIFDEPAVKRSKSTAAREADKQKRAALAANLRNDVGPTLTDLYMAENSAWGLSRYLPSYERLIRLDEPSITLARIGEYIDRIEPINMKNIPVPDRDRLSNLKTLLLDVLKPLYFRAQEELATNEFTEALVKHGLPVDTNVSQVVADMKLNQLMEKDNVPLITWSSLANLQKNALYYKRALTDYENALNNRTKKLLWPGEGDSFFDNNDKFMIDEHEVPELREGFNVFTIKKRDGTVLQSTNTLKTDVYKAIEPYLNNEKTFYDDTNDGQLKMMENESLFLKGVVSDNINWFKNKEEPYLLNLEPADERWAQHKLTQTEVADIVDLLNLKTGFKDKLTTWKARLFPPQKKGTIDARAESQAGGKAVNSFVASESSSQVTTPSSSVDLDRMPSSMMTSVSQVTTNDSQPEKSTQSLPTPTVLTLSGFPALTRPATETAAVTPLSVIPSFQPSSSSTENNYAAYKRLVDQEEKEDGEEKRDDGALLAFLNQTTSSTTPKNEEFRRFFLDTLAKYGQQAGINVSFNQLENALIRDAINPQTSLTVAGASYAPLLPALEGIKNNPKESATLLAQHLVNYSKQNSVDLEAEDLVNAIGSLGADLQNQPPAQSAAPRPADPGVDRPVSPLTALTPRHATPEPQEQGGEIIGLMNEIMTNLDLRRQNGLEVPAAVEAAFNNLFRGNKVQADELVGWANSLHFLQQALDESKARTTQLEQQMDNVLLSWHRELADLTPDELEIDRATGNELQNEISALNAYAQTIKDEAQADPAVVGDLMTRIHQLTRRITALRVKNRRLNNEVSSLQATTKRGDSLLQEYATANTELREANANHLTNLRWLENQNQEQLRGREALIARNADLLRQLTGANAQAQELQDRVDRDQALNTQLLQETQDLVQRATQYYNQIGEKDVIIQRLQEDNAELLDQYIQAKREHDTLHQMNEKLVGAAGSTLEALTTIFDQVGVNWQDRDALSVLGELGEYLQNQNLDLQHANARVSDLDRERIDLSRLNSNIIENMTAQKERELEEQRRALETAHLTALSDVDRKWKDELERAKNIFHDQVHEKNSAIRALEARNHQISADLTQRHQQLVAQINLEHEEEIQQLTDNYRGQIAALESDVFDLQSRLDKGVALESGFAHFGPYLRTTLETIKDVLDVDNAANQKHIDKLLDLAVDDLRSRLQTKRSLDATEYRMIIENNHKQNMSLFNQAQRLGTSQQKNAALAQARAQRANLAWNLVEQLALSPDPTAKANASSLMLSLAKQLVNGKGTFEEDEAAASFLKMYDDGTVGRVVSALATPAVAPVDSALSRKISDLETSMRNFVSIVSQRTAHVGHAQTYHPPRRVFVGRDGHYYQGNRRARATRATRAAKSRQQPRGPHGRFTVKKAKK